YRSVGTWISPMESVSVRKLIPLLLAWWVGAGRWCWMPRPASWVGGIYVVCCAPFDNCLRGLGGSEFLGCGACVVRIIGGDKNADTSSRGPRGWRGRGVDFSTRVRVV